MARKTIDDLVADACERLQRVDPHGAQEAVARGALLVDIRSSDQRRVDGAIPGTPWFPRNVLEWRLDPDSGATAPGFGDLDAEIVLFCDAGYASPLAAVTLQEIGFARATDLAGGFQAWRAAGLPVEPLGED
jgi:rhodanese-related sulfurtransferase